MSALRRLAPVVAGTTIAVIGGMLALPGAVASGRPDVQMAVTLVLVGVLVVVGLRRSRAARGYTDPFHPLVFPLGYVAFSFLAPVWFAIILDRPVGALARAVALAPGTAGLLILGIAGFALGALVPFRGSRQEEGQHTRAFGLTVLGAGRLLILLPLALMARAALTGAVTRRGADQVDVSILDTLNALLAPVTLTAVTLLLVGHRLLRRPGLLPLVDWALVGAAGFLSAAIGERGDAIALVLLFAVVLTLRRASMRPFLVAVGLIVVVAVTVLNYRAGAVGTTITDRTVTDILLGDMAVAGFTTGATAAVVPEYYEYAGGSTLAAALVRQVPSVVALPLFGPPDDVGARYFRDIINLSDANSGVGFSLPAEGYLNFGPLGVFGLCGLVGLLFAWAYPRLDLANGRASGLLYPVLVATLPFGLRSDALGSIKSVLYPLVIAGVVMVIARTVERNGPRGGRASTDVAAGPDGRRPSPRAVEAVGAADDEAGARLPDARPRVADGDVLA